MRACGVEEEALLECSECMGGWGLGMCWVGRVGFDGYGRCGVGFVLGGVCGVWVRFEKDGWGLGTFLEA